MKLYILNVFSESFIKKSTSLLLFHFYCSDFGRIYIIFWLYNIYFLSAIVHPVISKNGTATVGQVSNDADSSINPGLTTVDGGYVEHLGSIDACQKIVNAVNFLSSGSDEMVNEETGQNRLALLKENASLKSKISLHGKKTLS